MKNLRIAQMAFAAIFYFFIIGYVMEILGISFFPDKMMWQSVIPYAVILVCIFNMMMIGYFKKREKENPLPSQLSYVRQFRLRRHITRDRITGRNYIELNARFHRILFIFLITALLAFEIILLYAGTIGFGTMTNMAGKLILDIGMEVLLFVGFAFFYLPALIWNISDFEASGKNSGEVKASL